MEVLRNDEDSKDFLDRNEEKNQRFRARQAEDTGWKQADWRRVRVIHQKMSLLYQAAPANPVTPAPTPAAVLREAPTQWTILTE